MGNFTDKEEKLAVKVYDIMRAQFSADAPKWVPGGNSVMQDHARAIAVGILNEVKADHQHEIYKAIENERKGILKRITAGFSPFGTPLK